MVDDEDVQVTETTTSQEAPGTVTRRTSSAVAQGGPSGSVLGQRLVYWIVGVLEGLLAIRFVLSLLGANQGNAFADFIYGVTWPMVAPFQTLFNYTMQYGVARFELETVIAMLVIALIGYGITALLRIPQKGNQV